LIRLFAAAFTEINNVSVAHPYADSRRSSNVMTLNKVAEETPKKR
jgi:hypothetical protein